MLKAFNLLSRRLFWGFFRINGAVRDLESYHFTFTLCFQSRVPAEAPLVESRLSWQSFKAHNKTRHLACYSNETKALICRRAPYQQCTGSGGNKGDTN